MIGGDVGFWLVLALVVVVATAALVLQVAADRRRREALLVWTAERRWDWVGTDDSLVDLLPGAPFGRGHSRSARNVLSGRWDGRQAFAFDYTYKVTSGSGKDRRTRTYRHGVVAVHLPTALPVVQVGPENALDRVAQAFGADDIEVESHAFNSRYTVRSGDRRAAFAILHPRLVELLASVDPVAWRTDVSSRGPVIVSWWSGRLAPSEVQHRLLVLDRVLDSVPAWLWREHGWDPEPEGGDPGPEGGDPGPEGRPGPDRPET